MWQKIIKYWITWLNFYTNNERFQTNQIWHVSTITIFLFFLTCPRLRYTNLRLRNVMLNNHFFIIIFFVSMSNTYYYCLRLAKTILVVVQPPYKTICLVMFVYGNSVKNINKIVFFHQPSRIDFILFRFSSYVVYVFKQWQIWRHSVNDLPVTPLCAWNFTEGFHTIKTIIVFKIFPLSCPAVLPWKHQINRILYIANGQHWNANRCPKNCY